MKHLKEWQECQRIWESLGCPVPCLDPDYLAARDRLVRRLRSEYQNHAKARG